MQVQQEAPDYKKKYKTLKRKMRMLIYEQECFAEELRRAQRKLLRISRDKSFLLDRLLTYEEIDPSATDTDVTDSSASEDEQPPPTKRKKSQAVAVSSVAPSPGGGGGGSSVAMTTTASPSPSHVTLPTTTTVFMPPSPAALQPSSESTQPKKKIKVTKKVKVPGIPTAAMVSPASSASAASQMMRAPQTLPLSPSKSPAGAARTPPQPGHMVVPGGRGYQRITPPGMPGVIRISPGGARTSIPGRPSARSPAMTREEVEQHLELTSIAKSQFMSLERTPNILPDNIFNDNSNSCDFPDKVTDDEDLVIDMP